MIGVLGVLTLIPFIVGSAIIDAWTYDSASIFLQLVVIANFFGFAYYGATLLFNLKKISIISDANKKLFIFSSIVLIFQMIHIITVQIFNYAARKEIDSFFWTFNYILWSLGSEFLPEFALVLFLYPRGVWPLSPSPDTFSTNDGNEGDDTGVDSASINFSTESDYWTSEG